MSDERMFAVEQIRNELFVAKELYTLGELSKEKYIEVLKHLENKNSRL